MVMVGHGVQQAKMGVRWPQVMTWLWLKSELRRPYVPAWPKVQSRLCSCPCRCLIWAGSPDQPQATEKNSVQSTTRPISENKFCLKHRKWKIFFSKNCDVIFDLHFIYRIDKSSLDIRRLDRKIFLQPASKFYAVVIKDKLKLSRQLSESLSNKNPNRAGLN